MFVDDPTIGNRDRRAELLAVATSEEVTDIAEVMLERFGAPEVSAPAETGLIMMQVREPVCSDRFHVGEVVVSRAEVTWHGSTGWSMRLGSDRTAAMAAALCDAAGELDEGRSIVEELCGRIEDRVVTEAAAEWAALVPTIVEFEVLD